MSSFNNNETRKRKLAEYQREYRKRKKQNQLQQNQSVNSQNSIQETNNVHTNNETATASTSAITTHNNALEDRNSQTQKKNEYLRAYRARKRQELLQKQHQDSLNVEVANENKKRKLAEYQRAYRARKKQELLQQQQNVLIIYRAGHSATAASSSNNTAIENLSGRNPNTDIPVENTSNFATVSNNTDELPYSNFNVHKSAHKYFEKKFILNPFGHSCSCCHRIWFKLDLKSPTFQIDSTLLATLFQQNENLLLCSCYITSLRAKKIPLLAVHNGFAYPPMPQDLPPLNLVSERLISPRIPFMEIKRLRHVHG